MAEAIVPSRRNLHTGERIVLQEDFLQCPGINADVGISKNVNWEILGTNAVSASVSLNSGGGMNLSTQGAATDSSILLPHLDTGQSALTTISFAPSTAPQFVTTIKTPAALTNQTFWLGFKLTNTPTTATDDDQCFFKYVQGTDTTWKCNYSIADTDTAVDSGVTVAVATTYNMWITMTTGGIATFWINGNVVATTTALTASAALKPYIGILSAVDATVKTLIVRNVELSVTRA